MPSRFHRRAADSLQRFAVTPQAQAGTYTVSGIPVDVTAADASTARDQAIVDGQRAALQKLVENMMGVGEGQADPVAQRRRNLRHGAGFRGGDRARVLRALCRFAHLPLPVRSGRPAGRPRAGGNAGHHDDAHARRAGAHHHGESADLRPAAVDGGAQQAGRRAAAASRRRALPGAGRGQDRSGVQRRAGATDAGAGAARNCS